MKSGMTHSERHARRSMSRSGGSPSLVFLDHIRTGRHVSHWKMFIWSLNGLIPIMDDEQLREHFGEEAYAILVETPDQVKEQKVGRKDKRKVTKLKKKKRRLMPSDYAWLLRESGKKYETVPDPRLFLERPRSGHKHLSEEERDQQKAQRLHDWWEKHTEEISIQKSNASLRRAQKKLRHFRESIYNRREQEALGKKTLKGVVLESGPRTSFVRVKPELYEIIVCGECPVFIWKESPGREDTFQPNEYGEVKRVAIRPPGNSMKTPWAVFEVEWLRRKLREGATNSEWVWEIGLGDRVKEEEEGNI